MISSNNILKPSDGRRWRSPARTWCWVPLPDEGAGGLREQLKTAPRIASMAELEMGLAVKRLEFHSPVQMWHERPDLPAAGSPRPRGA